MHIVHTYVDGSLGGVIGVLFNEADVTEKHTETLDKIADVIESGNDVMITDV